MSVIRVHFVFVFFFFFNDTATTEIYTLSLHDALPICQWRACRRRRPGHHAGRRGQRSEEHTSELQSLTNLVCRLLLEKKKNKTQRKTLTNQVPSVYTQVSPSLSH